MSRIVFYCQFRHSLGHFARTRLIAEKVAGIGGSEVFLIFGGRRPPDLTVDPRIQVVDLPDAADSLTDAQGIAHRAGLIRAEIERLRPDKVLVDYLPLGLGGELMESLLEGPAVTEFIWGMPYPGQIKNAPRNPRIRKALARYGTALVYTSDDFLDPVESYAAYGVPAKVHRVGVVVPPPLPAVATTVPLVVGLAGAGVGAEAVINLLLEAAGPLLDSGRLRLRLVAGLYHSAAEAVERAKDRPNVEVLERGGAEVCTQDATVVFARCGYNTAFSMANTDLPVIFLPWPSPDPAYTEQFDRADALSELDGIWSVDERSESAVEDLSRTLSQALERGRRERVLPFETLGAERAADVLLSTGETLS